MQARPWVEQDTDSENGDTDAQSNSSSNELSLLQNGSILAQGGSWQGDAAAGGGGGFSAKELARIRDELLALQMHNQELWRERESLQMAQLVSASQTGVVEQQGGSQVNWNSGPTMPAMLSAAALGQKLSEQMKSGMPSFQSPFAKKADGQSGSGVGSHAIPGTDVATRDEVEGLRSEEIQLRSRLRAMQEEAEEFRLVAKEAQQVVRATEGTDATPLEWPSNLSATDASSDIREHAAERCNSAEDRRILLGLDDELLLKIAQTALACGREHQKQEGEARKDEGQTGSREEEADEKEDERVLLQRKIDSQKQAIEQMHQLFQKQESQIHRLKDKIAGREDLTVEKERVREAEGRVEHLSRQLAASQLASQQSQELRSQLKAMAEHTRQRDQVLGKMRTACKAQTAMCTAALEKLRMVQEDCGSLHQRHPREQPAHHRSPRAVASTARVCARPGTCEVGVQVSGDCLVLLERRARLQMALGDLGVEQSLLEKRAARELLELQGMARSQEERGRAEEEAKATAESTLAPRDPAAAGHSQVEDENAAEHRKPSKGRPHKGTVPAPPPGEPIMHDISSDNDGADIDLEDGTKSEDSSPAAEQPEGLAYIQRVAELEQRNEGLRRTLESLHQTEHSLRTGTQEKNELIAHLMKSGADALDQTHARRSGHREEDIAELEHIIEETFEDNVRLRNDIQTLAGEFRKMLVEEPSQREVSTVRESSSELHPA